MQTAVDAAIEAGKATLKYFRLPSLVIESKSDASPVTAADKEAEEIIRAIIRRGFPTHSITGEEFGTSEGSDPIRWIIDPLDGTRKFIHGVPYYGVLVGIEVEGEVVAGVVHMPALKETYYAQKSRGSYCNKKRIRVSKTSDLRNAMYLITDSSHALQDNDKRGGFLAIHKQARRLRGIGDCYGHMLVASGRADIMLDARMQSWDCAALKIIVEEAGGSFTDWNGNPTIYGESAVSINAALSEETLALLHAPMSAL